MTKHKKIRLLLTESLLYVVTLVGICLLPTLNVFAHNPGYKLSVLLGSGIPVYFAIGIALFAVLKLVFKKKRFFAGLLSSVIMFLLINFNLLQNVFSFVDSVGGKLVAALLLMGALIVGAYVFFAHVTKEKDTRKKMQVILLAVFAGLMAVNCVTYITNKVAYDKEQALQDAQLEQEPADAELTDDAGAEETVEWEQTLEVEDTAETAEDVAEEVTEEPEEEPEETVTEEPEQTDGFIEDDGTFVPDNPNIYMIVFDEYGSFEAMEEYYGYDATSMREYFNQIGVNISETSYAMWDETVENMTNILMLDNVSYGKSSTTLGKLRDRSTLISNLKKMGYSTYQYSTKNTIFKGVASLRESEVQTKYASSSTKDGVKSDEIMMNNSLLGALSNFLGTVTETEQIDTDSESLQKYGYYSSAEIKASKGYTENPECVYSGNKLLPILDFYEDAENFTYTEKRALFSYIRCPHVSFIFDEYGNPLSYACRMNWKDPQYYLGMYKYTTKHIATIYSNLIASDPNSIIIIMSDHGVRNHEQGFCEITEKEDRHVFISVYYCGHKLDIEGMSPVNIMRLIMKNLGQSDMEPIEDPVTAQSSDDLTEVVWPKK